MLIERKPNLSNLDKAVAIFNLLLWDTTTHSELRRIILGLGYLDPVYTNVELPQISELVFKHSKAIEVSVSLYRPWYWRSKAYAKTYTGVMDKIELNKYKVNRSIASICGTLAHEFGHLVEFYAVNLSPEVRFNHGDNSPVGKDNTFQYKFGRAIKIYVEENLERLLRDSGSI